MGRFYQINLEEKLIYYFSRYVDVSVFIQQLEVQCQRESWETDRPLLDKFHLSAR